MAPSVGPSSEVPASGMRTQAFCPCRVSLALSVFAAGYWSAPPLRDLVRSLGNNTVKVLPRSAVASNDLSDMISHSCCASRKAVIARKRPKPRTVARARGREKKLIARSPQVVQGNMTFSSPSDPFAIQTIDHRAADASPAGQTVLHVSYGALGANGGACGDSIAACQRPVLRTLSCPFEQDFL